MADTNPIPETASTDASIKSNDVPGSSDGPRIDIIYNMTSVCPHDCATCCVDAAHVTRRGDFISVRTEGLDREERIPRGQGGESIYDLASRHLQKQGLELTLEQKYAVVKNIDIGQARLDLSGGDPLTVSENVLVLRHASERLGRKNITLTATGAGLAQQNIADIAELIGEFNFTFDSASLADVAHRPKQYASRNLIAARQFAALGCVTRAEFPISRSTSDPDHLQRVYAMLHEAGIQKLLLMRLFRSAAVISFLMISLAPMNIAGRSPVSAPSSTSTEPRS